MYLGIRNKRLIGNCLDKSLYCWQRFQTHHTDDSSAKYLVNSHVKNVYKKSTA